MLIVNNECDCLNVRMLECLSGLRARNSNNQAITQSSNHHGALSTSWNVSASFCMAGTSPSGIHAARSTCSLLTMIDIFISFRIIPITQIFNYYCNTQKEKMSQRHENPCGGKPYYLFIQIGVQKHLCEAVGADVIGPFHIRGNVFVSSLCFVIHSRTLWWCPP